MITVPPVEDDEREPPQFVSRASLVRIIRPRVEEILEMVRDRLRSFAVRGRAARTRRADRGCKPAHRPRRSRRAHLAASRKNWPSAWLGRFAGQRQKGRPLRWLQVCLSTRRRPISNTSNRGERGN